MCGIYRGRGSENDPAPFQSLRMGSTCPIMVPAEVANGGVAYRAQLPGFFHHEEVWVVSMRGQVDGRRERRPNIVKEGNKNLLPLPLWVKEKVDIQSCSKWHCFFLKEQCMKRCNFSQNTLFHLNKKWRQRKPYGHLFQIDPWSWISSIESLIGHQTSIFMQSSPWFDQIKP